jgi:legumain
MFEGLLPENINIYATTAANAVESSYGTYCSPDDVVNGVHIGACLGDLYSVSWMEDTDVNDYSTETLAVQFDTVKTIVTGKSHVMEYG